jgi:transcriptional regulator with AAA-type ATPase domain
VRSSSVVLPAPGTLFLDEFQDLPPTPQSMLLRFLETGRFVRVGGTQEVHCGLRVVVATTFQPRN